jgi:hypothetical protein
VHPYTEKKSRGDLKSHFFYLLLYNTNAPYR